MNDHVVPDKSRYAIYELNVISSTKISQKTKQILRIFGVLPSAPNAQHAEDTAQPAPNSLPAVVAITARANVASKLISVVEIVKRDLAKRAKAQSDASAETGEDRNATTVTAANGQKQLYQYTTVISTTVAVKLKPVKTITTATTASKELLAPAPAAQQGQKRKRGIDSSQGSIMMQQGSPKKAKFAQKGAENDHEDEHDIEQDVLEEDEAFEQMRVPGERTLQTVQEHEKQEKEVAVLIIYLSMAPIPELAEAYGEQTS